MAIGGPSYECLYENVGTNGRVNDDVSGTNVDFQKC